LPRRNKRSPSRVPLAPLRNGALKVGLLLGDGVLFVQPLLVLPAPQAAEMATLWSSMLLTKMQSQDEAARAQRALAQAEAAAAATATALNAAALGAAAAAGPPVAALGGSGGQAAAAAVAAAAAAAAAAVTARSCSMGSVSETAPLSFHQQQPPLMNLPALGPWGTPMAAAARPPPPPPQHQQQQQQHQALLAAAAAALGATQPSTPGPQLLQHLPLSAPAATPAAFPGVSASMGCPPGLPSTPLPPRSLPLFGGVPYRAPLSVPWSLALDVGSEQLHVQSVLPEQVGEVWRHCFSPVMADVSYLLSAHSEAAAAAAAASQSAGWRQQMQQLQQAAAGAAGTAASVGLGAAAAPAGAGAGAWGERLGQAPPAFALDSADVRALITHVSGGRGVGCRRAADQSARLVLLIHQPGPHPPSNRPQPPHHHPPSPHQLVEFFAANRMWACLQFLTDALYGAGASARALYQVQEPARRAAEEASATATAAAAAAPVAAAATAAAAAAAAPAPAGGPVGAMDQRASGGAASRCAEAGASASPSPRSPAVGSRQAVAAASEHQHPGGDGQVWPLLRLTAGAAAAAARGHLAHQWRALLLRLALVWGLLVTLVNLLPPAAAAALAVRRGSSSKLQELVGRQLPSAPVADEEVQERGV
jgi:hypothetical protein